MKKAGLPPESLEQMQAVTFPNGRGTWQRWALLVCVALAAAGVVVALRRRRALVS